MGSSLMYVSQCSSNDSSARSYAIVDDAMQRPIGICILLQWDLSGPTRNCWQSDEWESRDVTSTWRQLATVKSWFLNFESLGNEPAKLSSWQRAFQLFETKIQSRCRLGGDKKIDGIRLANELTRSSWHKHKAFTHTNQQLRTTGKLLVVKIANSIAIALLSSCQQQPCELPLAHFAHPSHAFLYPFSILQMSDSNVAAQPPKGDIREFLMRTVGFLPKGRPWAQHPRIGWWHR